VRQCGKEEEVCVCGEGDRSPLLAHLIKLVMAVPIAGAGGGGVMGLLGTSLPVTVCQIVVVVIVVVVILVVEIAQELFEVEVDPVLSPYSCPPHVHSSAIHSCVGLATRRGVGGRALGVGRREDGISHPLVGRGNVVGDELLHCVAALLARQ
jgi:hypothetical protein